MADGEDHDSFLAVFLKYRKRLETFVSRWVGPAPAADIVQDLFLRLWRRPIERPNEMAAYLFRVAHNLAIDHIRAEQVRMKFISSEAGEDPAADAAAPERASARDIGVLAAALRRLPERTSLVFLLNKSHGRSYPDIARLLKISVKTVEREMVRALAACAEAKAAGKIDSR